MGQWPTAIMYEFRVIFLLEKRREMNGHFRLPSGLHLFGELATIFLDRH
jgi:hypothetical protein